MIKRRWLNMGDKRVEILSREDQGSVFMLCLGASLAIIATVYFLCRWHNKRTNKQVEASRRAATAAAKKDRLKQTFSRFSQVDEELTMTHLDDDDLQLIKSCQSQSTTSINKEKVAPQTGTSMAVASKTTTVTVTEHSGKPYLETDI
ncbi:hypothetical protein ACF0H5_015026 [Mactra antiquata]